MNGANKYLIIGNGIAGVSATQQLRDLDKKGEIHIFSAEQYPFYSRIRLPQILAGLAKPADIYIHDREWYKENDVRFHPGARVEGIDPRRQKIITPQGAFPYDRLLLATGSKSFIPPIPGVDLEGVFTLRTLEDALAIAAYARGRESAVLIGGGLLGLEAAYGLLQAGIKKISVLEAAPRLLPRQTDRKAAAILQRLLEERGYDFFIAAKSKEILGQGGKTRGVSLEDGRFIEGETVLLSAGVRADTALAGEAGLKTDLGVVVDDYLCTDREDIFAAGDVAQHRGRMYGIWPAAREQGAAAGLNMAGEKKRYRGTTPGNRLKVTGIDLVTAGELEGAGDYTSQVEEGEKSYRKLVLNADGTLAGCILLGDIAGHAQIVKAVQEKQKL